MPTIDILSRVALVVALASGGAVAHPVQTYQSEGCSIHSDYNLSVNARSVIMTRDSGQPKALVMRQGRLFVDDQWVDLSAADRDRIAAFERGTREAMPLAQSLGREAADIAFTVLGEVSAGFSSDPAAKERMAKARRQLDARLARSVTATRFDGEDLGDGIGDAIGAVIPEIIGEIAGGAIRAAFSGDTSWLQRLQGLDTQIEALVEPRATALERRAEQLCARIVELDRLDNALQYRLPGGDTLDLIEADKRPRQRRNLIGG